MRVGITGHQAAPDQAWEFVRAGLESGLRGLGSPLVGITSLAAGADQLFAQIVLDLGGTIEVVIPSADYESTFADNGERFHALLAQAVSAKRLPFPAPSEEAYFEAGKVVVDASQILFAVWDGEPARGLGGAADIVRYAEAVNVPVKVIWPKGISR